jgi:hypothetical protein
MKAQLQTRNGKLTIDVPTINRYRVVAKSSASNIDITQFWTWIKYEMRIDYNQTSKIIGCNEYNFNKIKNRWGDKFSFQK